MKMGMNLLSVVCTPQVHKITRVFTLCVVTEYEESTLSLVSMHRNQNVASKTSVSSYKWCPVSKSQTDKVVGVKFNVHVYL